MKFNKDKVRTFSSIFSFCAMLGMAAYLVAEDVVVKEESRRTVQLCREEAEAGCPLLLESLDEISVVNRRISERNESLRAQVEVYRNLAIQMESHCVMQSDGSTESQE